MGSSQIGIFQFDTTVAVGGQICRPRVEQKGFRLLSQKSSGCWVWGYEVQGFGILLRFRASKPDLALLEGLRLRGESARLHLPPRLQSRDFGFGVMCRV